MKRLMNVRLKEVRKSLKEAKGALAKEVKFVSATRNKVGVRLAWEEIRETRRETWRLESARLQRKVEHLDKKSKECRRHKVCRELDKMVGR